MSGNHRDRGERRPDYEEFLETVELAPRSSATFSHPDRALIVSAAEGRFLVIPDQLFQAAYSVEADQSYQVVDLLAIRDRSGAADGTGDEAVIDWGPDYPPVDFRAVRGSLLPSEVVPLRPGADVSMDEAGRFGDPGTGTVRLRVGISHQEDEGLLILNHHGSESVTLRVPVGTEVNVR